MTTVLKNINLKINSNENWVILGANGSGKSTLMKLFSHDIYPNAAYNFKKQIFIGPLVPDTAFIGKHLKYYVAMYHDQGLIPLKTLYFKESINLTLNLPIIRTSVDHGTAFDIAYQNKANSKSYINAIKEAIFRAKEKY